ncbi:unnamed protein product, partial [Prorocentrum cordatum]
PGRVPSAQVGGPAAAAPTAEPRALRLARCRRRGGPPTLPSESALRPTCCH